MAMIMYHGKKCTCGIYMQANSISPRKCNKIQKQIIVVIGDKASETGARHAGKLCVWSLFRLEIVSFSEPTQLTIWPSEKTCVQMSFIYSLPLALWEDIFQILFSSFFSCLHEILRLTTHICTCAIPGGHDTKDKKCKRVQSITSLLLISVTSSLRFRPEKSSRFFMEYLLEGWSYAY